MSEMVERVAVAMVERFQRIDFEERQRENAFRALARAAIEAMREPTEEMKHGMYAAEVAAYCALIDAALADGEAKAATTPS